MALFKKMIKTLVLLKTIIFVFEHCFYQLCQCLHVIVKLQHSFLLTVTASVVINMYTFVTWSINASYYSPGVF